ncbi:hypothetical protein DFR29_102511 [Tahibacter aquaticus]|uniref:Uncharacterized protein n=1 Tax=Tahibacter aquaticus TaxID=520092 RepID=A0A4R6Z8B0_9GAMM|nr:hypothetical protein [Tahibacter aquaticus]TDR47849.1 hypothetical protein DFR29_102511 [Tahibacter aquaticus]
MATVVRRLGRISITLLRRLAWLVAILYALYLIAANVFLNAGFGPDVINRKPERFSMHWQNGLSLYPGQVALWNVKLGGHARRVRWQASAQKIGGHIALLPLLRREFHVTTAHCDEVRGGLDLAEELASAEPRPGGWVLRFSLIDTGTLREVRWGAHTLTTHGAAEFGMWKQLRGGALEIFPSSARLHQLQLRQGDTEWLKDGSASLAFELPRHSRSDAQGWHRLALGRFALALDAQTPAFAVHMDQEPRWRGALRNSGGGRIQADLQLSKGALVPGGTLELSVPLEASDSSGKHWTQQARLNLAVTRSIDLKLDLPPPPDGSGRINADLQLDGLDVLPHDKAPPLLPRVSGLVDLQWRFDSLAWLGPLLAKTPWLQLDGAGELAAAIKLSKGRIDAGSTLSIPAVNVQADVQGQRFSGRARADGLVDSRNGELAPRVDIAVENFQGAPVGDPNAVFLRGKNLKLELRSTGRVIEFRDSLRARLLFDRADVPDLRAFNSYLPGQALRFLGGRGQLGGDIALDAVGKVGKGNLKIQARQARLAVNDLEFSGDVDVNAQLSRADLKNEEFVLDGSTLALRKVKVSDPERASPGDWWAEIRFDRGRLQWGSPLRIDTSASVRMPDISLLLALFTRHKDYPKWVLRALDAGEVNASTRAQMKDAAIVLEDLAVSNDRFDVRARLRLAQRKAQGDLYLRWAKLGLGLELKEGERKFHLLKAREWFEQQPRLLPASR